MTNLGKMLLAFEQKHDMHSQAIADQIGLNKSTYSRIKGGGVPTSEHLVLILSWMLETEKQE